MFSAFEAHAQFPLRTTRSATWATVGRMSHAIHHMWWCCRCCMLVLCSDRNTCDAGAGFRKSRRRTTAAGSDTQPRRGGRRYFTVYCAIASSTLFTSGVVGAKPAAEITNTFPAFAIHAQVESVFTLSISQLLDPSFRAVDDLGLRGHIPAFTAGPSRVWGLTAIITEGVLQGSLTKVFADWASTDESVTEDEFKKEPPGSSL